MSSLCLVVHTRVDVVIADLIRTWSSRLGDTMMGAYILRDELVDCRQDILVPRNVVKSRRPVFLHPRKRSILVAFDGAVCHTMVDYLELQQGGLLRCSCLFCQCLWN